MARRPEMERFWEKTMVAGACIVWTGHVGKINGYGYFDARDPTTKKKYRSVLAHRFIHAYRVDTTRIHG